MPQRIEIIRHVPTKDKARIEADYVSLGAAVTWENEGGGLWTVTATFPATATAAVGATGNAGGGS